MLYFLLFNLISITQGSYLINKNCNNHNTLDDCIDNFGCGWCNETDLDTEKEVSLCTQVAICPLKIHENSTCYINEKYYNGYNCFLNNFIIYSLYICGFILIFTICYISIIYSYFGYLTRRDLTTRQSKFLIFLYCFLILLGISILLLNDFIFSNIISVLIFLIILTLIIFFFAKVLKKNNKYEYQINDVFIDNDKE